MSYKLKSLKKVEKNKVLMDLEITNNYLKKSLNTAYKNISDKVNIPGFRKGKVPYNIIDVNFGKDYVLNEAATIAISDLYPRIVEESRIKPIYYPKIKINKIDLDEPLNFEVTVEVEPEIEIPKYRGIEVTGISQEVFNDEIEKQLENLRNNYAILEPVEEDRAAQTGDFVIIDFEGKIDGNNFEGNSAQDYSLEIGSKTLFEEFESSLVGMKKGDHKDVSLELPESIANQELYGRKADFSIDLKEIKRKVLPELDQPFIGNFGDYQNIEEFKDFIAARLSEQKKRSRRDRIISDTMNKLVQDAKFDVPEPMIENRLKQYNEDLKKDLEEHNISRQDYLKSFKLTEEQFKENMRTSAIREVKEFLIVNALEKAESANIEPSEDQVLKETETILSAYKKEEEKVKLRNYLESENGKKDLNNSIKRRNLFDLLVKNAKIIEEKPVEDNKLLSRKLWIPGGTPAVSQSIESDDKNDEDKK